MGKLTAQLADSTCEAGWPGQNEEFQRIKSEEDQLRQLYALPRTDSQRPDLTDPTHHLIPLPEEEFLNIRQQAQQILQSRESDPENSDLFINWQNCGYLWQIPKIKNLDRLYPFGDPIMSLLRQAPEDVRQHVCLAGGIVLDFILQGHRHRAEDYDLFIVGSEQPEQFAEQVVELLTNKWRLVMATRNKYAVTLFLIVEGKKSQYGQKERVFAVKVQIILRSYLSPSEVVTGFDLDACGVCWWQNQFYCTPRAHYALQTMTQYVDLDRLSPSYEFRLAKYSLRGFAVHVPIKYGSTKLLQSVVRYSNMTADHRTLYQVSPLVKLLTMEAKLINGASLTPFSKSDYQTHPGKGWFKCYDFDSPVNWLYDKKKERVNSYQTEQPNLIWDISSIASSEKEYDLPLKVKFMTDNPGQQTLTGSFHPLQMTWTKWSSAELTLLQPITKRVYPERRILPAIRKA